MYIKIFQLYQFVIQQSSSNVVKWLWGFLIGLLLKQTLQKLMKNIQGDTMLERKTEKWHQDFGLIWANSEITRI